MKCCVLGLALLLAGCVDPPPRCVEDDDCTRGHECVGLRCIPAPDEGASMPPDAGQGDTGLDAGLPDADIDGGDAWPDAEPAPDMAHDTDMARDAAKPDADAAPNAESCNGLDDDDNGLIDDGLDCSLQLEGRLVWVAGGGESDEYRLEGRGRILGGTTMSNDEWTLTGDLVVGGQ